VSEDTNHGGKNINTIPPPIYTWEVPKIKEYNVYDKK
jgi:hypothetical protein